MNCQKALALSLEMIQLMSTGSTDDRSDVSFSAVIKRNPAATIIRGSGFSPTNLHVKGIPKIIYTIQNLTLLYFAGKKAECYVYISHHHT